ncbi:MAG: LptF/LptG family permease [Phycisphaerales bacterium]|nr:LptF/LptG family permease [Phycisphaerales bacterium]
MLWTLWRAILFEFWRMLLISTSVVVAAIAFAATVKPLADGSLTVDQAFRFLGYAIPPMLAYALPFAAGFSATMTYNRMVSENELTAVFASGVSHKQILFPMLISGIILSGSLVTLNSRVIPHFLQRMEEMVTRDFAKILVNSLSQGRSAMVGNTEIHADRVEEVTPEPDSLIEQQFLLGGVVMIEANDDGSIRIDGTAARAWILILPAWALSPDDRARIADDSSMAVVMKFVDLTINEQGDAVSWESVTSPAIPIPRVFKDDPKYMSSVQMKRLQANPDLMNFVDRRRVALGRSIASTQTLATLTKQINTGQPITLISNANQTITLLAGSISNMGNNWILGPLESTNSIEIEINNHNNNTISNTERLIAESAVLNPNASGTIDPFDTQSSPNTLSLDLNLTNITILGDAMNPQNQIAQTQYNSLHVDNDPLPNLLNKPSFEMLEAAADYRHVDSIKYNSRIARFADQLEFEIAHLGREVLSKTHERWAFSTAALIMVLAGGVTAMRLRYAQPLMIYLWSFFPALTTILFIAGGQQAVHKSGAVALPLLWSGILLITCYTLNAFRKASKH